jgi:transcriptional regulator with GAF, ATPase, and Fis domain
LNLPLEMQAKLLRVLQEGVIRPVGSNKRHKINVTIVAAASSSLGKRIELGQFREDLNYGLFRTNKYNTPEEETELSERAWSQVVH